MGLSRGSMVQGILRGLHLWSLAGRERRTVFKTGGVLSPSSEAACHYWINLPAMGALCLEAAVGIVGVGALSESLGDSSN